MKLLYSVRPSVLVPAQWKESQLLEDTSKLTTGVAVRLGGKSVGLPLRALSYIINAATGSADTYVVPLATQHS